MQAADNRLLARVTRATQATDAAVRNLKPGTDRYFRWFENGLGVRVTPAGTRTWCYWYRDGRSKKLLTLGTYPAMSVAEAKAAHREAQNQRARGADPVEVQRAERLQAAAAKAEAARAQAAHDARPTLRDAFTRWRETDLVPRVEPDGTRLGRKDGGAVMAQVFAKWVFPTLGDKPAAEVTKGDLMAVVDAAKAQGKKRTAQSLFANLRQMLDFAADRDIVPTNPLAAVKKARAVGRPAVRKRVLADWEIARLLERLPTLNLHTITELALRFMLATGQRSGEVVAMRKSDISPDGMLWTIPADRYKTGETHTVPLSKLARDLIALAGTLNHGSAYVFPSPQSIGKVRPKLGAQEPEDAHLDGHSLSRAIKRKLGTAVPADQSPESGKLGLEEFRPHDLRRTCRTGMAALGVPDFIAERVIGHKLQGMLAVYNQHDYLDERREALEKWAAKLLAMHSSR